jgi:hypothetical protein
VDGHLANATLKKQNNEGGAARTLEQLGSPRSQRNQAFQCCPILALALLVLLDASGDLGLLFL